MRAYYRLFVRVLQTRPIRTPHSAIPKPAPAFRNPKSLLPPIAFAWTRRYNRRQQLFLPSPLGRGAGV